MEEQERQQTEDQAEPELLYHYTDEKGLIGILESQNLWASHYRFLNDYEEGRGVKEFFRAMEEASHNDSTLSPRLWKGLKEVLINTNEAFDAYFSSFTRKNDKDELDRPGDRLS